MAMTERSSADVETRVHWFAEDADLGWVADALVASRAQILDRWLEAAAAQAFHAGRREHAVADHIPALFDALTALLRRSASRFVNPDAPLDDAAVLAAAGEHAAARVRQGLTPPDIVVEFRLLRQEIWHALRLRLPDKVPTTDVIAAELVVNDALDGAITMGLTALVERVEEVREELLATTIHEVRQPLAAILGQVQLARRSLRSPTPNLARISSSLEKIEDGAARMSAMLTTLLDSSRIVLGDLALAPVDADLRDVVREALDIVGPEVADRVTVEIRPGVETSGRWDAERLEHVFANLLSNAGKYSPPETPIRLTVDGDDAMLRVAFQDEGIGIAPQDLPRLFDRYTRGREAMAAGIEGFGLGLYLCRGIVEAHGGRIWAESDGPGTGTTIRLELPHVVAQPAAAEPSPRP
jgi:signal transduction histidine kinase